MTRKQFLLSSFAAALARAAGQPLRIGHRQANMGVAPGPSVFDLARRIPGISGVELQIHFKGSTLWDRETALAYRSAAENTGMAIPSLAAVWRPGVSLIAREQAEENLRKGIAAAELLRARVILVTAFDKNCPNMEDEASYGPVIALLQKVAPQAADAGVALAIESSQSPAHDRKLVDLVNRPAVGIYYDLDNIERFGHKGLSVPGVAVVGAARIRQIHLKNEARLLEEPGRVNWDAALKAIKAIGYNGWFVFESSHSGPEQCIEATRKNIAFVERYYTSSFQGAR